eukprot:gene25526-31996_t
MSSQNVKSKSDPPPPQYEKSRHSKRAAKNRTWKIQGILASFTVSGGVSALESLMDLDVDDNNEEDEADLLASTKKVVQSLTNGHDADSDEDDVKEEEETDIVEKTPLKLNSANNTPSNTPSTGVKSVAVKSTEKSTTLITIKNSDGLTVKAAEKLKEKEQKEALKAEKRALKAAAELLKKTTAANANVTPKVVKNGHGTDSSSKPTPITSATKNSAPSTATKLVKGVDSGLLLSAMNTAPSTATKLVKGVGSGLLLSAMKSAPSTATKLVKGVDSVKSPAKHVTVNTSTGRARSSSSHAPPALRLEYFTSKSFESGSPVTSPATVSDSQEKQIPRYEYEALSAESSDEEEEEEGIPFSAPSTRPSVFSVKKDRKSLTSTTATATGAQSANVIYGLPSPVSDAKEVVESPESASKKAKLEVNLFAPSQLYEGRNSLRAAEMASKEEYDAKIAADAAEALTRKKAKKITLESKVDREKVIAESIPPLPTISSPNKVGRPRKTQHPLFDDTTVKTLTRVAAAVAETAADKSEKKRKSLKSADAETVAVAANKVGRKRKSASTGGDVFVPSSPATDTEKVEGSNKRESANR